MIARSAHALRAFLFSESSSENSMSFDAAIDSTRPESDRTTTALHTQLTGAGDVFACALPDATPAVAKPPEPRATDHQTTV